MSKNQGRIITIHGGEKVVLTRHSLAIVQPFLLFFDRLIDLNCG